MTGTMRGQEEGREDRHDEGQVKGREDRHNEGTGGGKRG